MTATRAAQPPAATTPSRDHREGVRLSPGDRLPPVRKLAEDLVINPNTVARAYRDLETEGLLETRQGSGVTVSRNGSPLARGQQIEIHPRELTTVVLR